MFVNRVIFSFQIYIEFFHFSFLLVECTDDGECKKNGVCDNYQCRCKDGFVGNSDDFETCNKSKQYRSLSRAILPSSYHTNTCVLDPC